VVWEDGGSNPASYPIAGKKEAAGAAVAVIQIGIMEIEWYSVVRCVILGAVFFGADGGKS
jgi:hypothetical protein